MGTGTSIGRVRGLGSAHEGTHHWWHQRMSAGSNLLLMTWLIVSLIRLPDLGYETVQAWLSAPIAAVPMILLVLSVFYHLKAGLQVVIEDYARDAGRIVLMTLLNFFAIGGAVFAIFAILKIAFTTVTTGAPAA
ncbi:succinate dehydrogenase, hydrophobic membrane anchor protein [Sphingomonas sp.]|uniref:succinate dehydrogenase, hydrophobic membrane anchor protein n=1 Tax=Sphingomonas sp. TaxID=28214 RepID=UPI00262A10E7|nr:succinate dehydrogenase, hydrophobic membrane anchor protein [Sphingomonas sp.]MDK2768567.1 succinate dehydrogenase, hydrophobic membrane anchor protein [Sphingomonas sp.]